MSGFASRQVAKFAGVKRRMEKWGLGFFRSAWFRELESPLDERYVPLALGGMTLAVYLLTMAPRLTWRHAGRDGGDLISAAWFLGVPHPTGYPTYTMLAWLFTRLPFGSVAWRVHLLSGLAGAGTVALVYLVVVRMMRVVERGRVPTTLGAAVGALLLGFSPLFWGHSLIAEVYTLHLFFIVLVLWLVLRWRDGDGPLPLAALALGVGMGNRVTLTFLGPAIVLLLWSGRERLSWREVTSSTLALIAGLMVYLYLPWRASADPLINWGDPDTWENFRWMVTGQGYRRFFFALPRDELLPRLEDWWTLTGVQFTPMAWPLAALGLWELTRRDHWLALGSFLHAAINLVYSVFYSTTDAFVYLLPVYLYLALWMGRGTVALLDATRQLRGLGNNQQLKVVTGLVTAGLLLLPLISLVEEWDGMDLTHDRRAETYAREALEVVEPDALILVGYDPYTFALWYYHYVEGLRPDVLVVNYEMLAFDWYNHTIAVHHPGMALPPPEAATTLNSVLRNLDQRPVYIDSDKEDLPGLELTPDGPLWRVRSP